MTTQAITFDFAAKTAKAITLADCRRLVDEGAVVWLDVDGRQPGSALAAVQQALPHADWLVPMVGVAPNDTVVQLTPDHLLLTGWACWSTASMLCHGWFDVIVARNLVVTIDRDGAPFWHHVRASYQSDFEAFAQSQSFLLYEVLDAVIEGYREAVGHFDRRVTVVQTALLRETHDDTFEEVSRLQLELVRVRRHLTPLREALARLVRRKSTHVSPTTQPYLSAFAEAVGSILADLSDQRNLLLDSLNLNMSIVGNRTNQIMNRLTFVSFIFLPLTFLCGIYGMNFKQPEYGWPNGYTYFWCLVALFFVGGLVLMRRMRIL